MLKEKDGYLKGNAVIALALAKSQSVTGLTDRDKFVRTCAQAGSAYRGNKKYVNELKAALEDTDEYVQVAAAWGLASLGEKEGIDLLDKTLATGLREQDRERAKELTRLRIFAGDSLISLPERDVESKAE
jgi:HEAT repeat protein